MFFSVRRNYRIGGRLYQPCICYELTRELEETIKGLEAKGTARLYNERVFFQNGNILQAVPEKAQGPIPDIPEKEPVQEPEIVQELEPVQEQEPESEDAPAPKAATRRRATAKAAED